MTINKKDLLEEVCKQLDITPTMYKSAVDRCQSVENCLKGKGLPAELYPQGSFRLGTVIRPLRNGADSDYDIDLVCQLSQPKKDTLPSITKNSVGDILKGSTEYKKILDDEGKRCWTLIYADQNGIGFHLDILPSVNESEEIIKNLMIQYSVPVEYATSAIAITEKHKDTNAYSWLSSNPRGYANWFDGINQPFYQLVETDMKKSIFENNRHLHIYNSVEDVPPLLIRTPLQRVIQILKRHRDIRFNGHRLEDDKPISMIITTLVALIVKNYQCSTTDVFLLLRFVVTKLLQYAALLTRAEAKIDEGVIPVIERKTSTNKWYIPNPVNPAENFADRWHENNNRKARAFFTWLQWVSADLIDNLEKADFKIADLKSSFGENVIDKVQKNYEKKTSLDGASVLAATSISKPSKPWSCSIG